MTKEEKELRACYHWTEWERKAKEFEQTNNNLLDVINNQDVKIADLEKKLVEILDAKCTSCTELGGMQLKINKLEQQIEKMKCCQNCEIFSYHNSASCGEPVLIDKSHGTYVCDKWKLKEIEK